MKEVIFRREKEKVNMLATFNIVLEDGQTISLKNGETKKISVQKMPVSLYAKLLWLKSKDITLEDSTAEVILKSEKSKNWFASRMASLLILITLVPKMIWEETPLAKNISVVGLCIILAWTIYAFIIKSDDWIVLDIKHKE